MHRYDICSLEVKEINLDLVANDISLECSSFIFLNNEEIFISGGDLKHQECGEDDTLI